MIISKTLSAVTAINVTPITRRLILTQNALKCSTTHFALARPTFSAGFVGNRRAATLATVLITALTASCGGGTTAVPATATDTTSGTQSEAVIDVVDSTDTEQPIVSDTAATNGDSNSDPSDISDNSTNTDASDNGATTNTTTDNAAAANTPDTTTEDNNTTQLTQLDFEDVDPATLPLTLTPLPSQTTGLETTTASNQAPFFDDLTDQIVFAGDTMELVLAPRDPDGDVPGLFTSALPVSAEYIDNFNGTRTLRWRPLQPDVGIFPVTITAVDPAAPLYRTSQTIRIQVVLPDDPSTIINLPPTLDRVDDHTVRQGDTVVMLVKAVDPNGTFGPINALNLPVNATFLPFEDEEDIHRLEWDTTGLDTGIVALEFRAVDAVDPQMGNNRTINIIIKDPADFAPDGQRLRALADARDFDFGYASLLEWYQRPDADLYADTARLDFNIVSPENSMKWGQINPFENEFDWEASDRLVSFAKANDIKIHGHPLIWHRQLPRWVQKTEASKLRPVMLRYIREVVNRYNNDVAIWDVVNEALEEDGTFRQSQWFNALGESYIADAFRQARLYARDAELLYNEYDVSWDGPKSDGMYSLMQSLLAQNVPVDGVGFQMHIDAGFDRFDEVRNNFQRFADLGLDVYVTELDVGILDGQTEAQQAAVYEQVLSLCLEQPACKALQIWGFTDRYSWRKSLLPLIMDKDYQPKPAWYALQQRLMGN